LSAGFAAGAGGVAGFGAAAGLSAGWADAGAASVTVKDEARAMATVVAMTLDFPRMIMVGDVTPTFVRSG